MCKTDLATRSHARRSLSDAHERGRRHEAARCGESGRRAAAGPAQELEEIVGKRERRAGPASHAARRAPEGLEKLIDSSNERTRPPLRISPTSLSGRARTASRCR